MRVGVHALDNLLVPIVQRRAHLVAQDVEIAENRLQRRAKFMRKIGQRLHMQALLPLTRLHCRADSLAGRRLDGCSGRVTII